MAAPASPSSTPPTHESGTETVRMSRLTPRLNMPWRMSCSTLFSSTTSASMPITYTRITGAASTYSAV